MRKALALFVAAIILTAALPFSSVAFGAADGKMAVNFINTGSVYEGSSIIMTPGNSGTLGDYGNYAWWSVYIFDWDATEKVYKCTEINRQSNNTDKSAMKIPETGFALGMCVGNDYPSLGINDKPNYVSDMIKETHEAAATLTVGSKVYLYGIDLLNKYVQNNGKNWYEPDYVTDSFIKIGTPESGMTAYNPETATEGKIAYKVTPTQIDNVVYAANETIIFTPAYGDFILPRDAKYSTYDWWSVIVCDWNSAEGCYTVISKDGTRANSSPKFALIPDGGFTVASCSALLDNVDVGDKVFLQNIDISASSMSSGAAIYFNKPGDTSAVYTPDMTGRLGNVNITNMPSSRTACTSDGFTVRWDAVSGAEKYYVAVNSSDIYPDGEILEFTSVTGCEYTLTTELKIGSSYTVSVYATAAGKPTSEVARKTLSCVSQSAVDSALKDKTVIAFGDSLTARSGWVSMMYGYIGTSVINSGVGGDTTAAGLGRINGAVYAYDPDVVMIGFGMNDQAISSTSGKPLTSPEDYEKNLTEMITGIQAAGADVVLICPNPVCTEAGYYVSSNGLNYGTAESMAQFCGIIRSLAFRYGCQLVDMNAEFTNSYSKSLWAAGDGIHQSPEGHRFYAECIGNALSAIYNDADSAKITVNCRLNGTVVASHTYVGAKGSHVYMTAPELGGLSTSSPAKMLTYGTDTEITFEYTSDLALKADSFMELVGEYIYLNREGVTESELLAQLATEGCTVSSANERIGTGATVTTRSGSVFTTVLAGDVDGDGQVSSFDYVLIKRHALQLVQLSGAEFRAADMDRDDEINSLDYIIVKRQVLGIK